LAYSTDPIFKNPTGIEINTFTQVFSRNIGSIPKYIRIGGFKNQIAPTIVDL